MHILAKNKKRVRTTLETLQKTLDYNRIRIDMRATLSKRLQGFGTSVFSEMTALAQKHKAINLSQGYPNFPGPEFVKEEARKAIREDKNQYAPSSGVPELRKAIVNHEKRFYELEFETDSEVTVFAGATEGIFSIMMALLNPGDEVVILEPFYDSYVPSVVMAGGIPRFVTLKHPDFSFDPEQLASAFSAKTKVVLLNSPHNPTGRVLTQDELSQVAKLAIEHDSIVVTDEVYEHITFDNNKHIPMMSLPGMRERTIKVSSTAKTFSLTGWKIGYAVAPAHLSSAIRTSHQFVIFCAATPLQYAMAKALRIEDDYFVRLHQDYQHRRDILFEALRDVGFNILRSQGTYFIMAEFSPFGFDDDVEFCRYLTSEIGVAAIPPSFFYSKDSKKEGKHLVRFCFPKTEETLREAGRRLRKLSRT